jgi:putative nucleotidyltransferase with HDIG domain
MDVIKRLKDAGFEGYLVGGAVRDMLLNRPTKDWDYATNAPPDKIQEIFPEANYDNAFGTVSIVTDEGLFEITPFRKEGKYSDGRHPDTVIWANTLEEDLARRELTISAMAFDGKTIIDPYHGREDLKNRIVRAVGTPDDRYKEDALRMIRAVRIATQLGLVIEEKTFAAIKTNAKLLEKISGERIRDELEKILVSDFPADGIRLLLNAGLLQIIFPELTRGADMKQPGHHIYDVLTHSIKSLEACQNKNWIVRLAALLHDVGKPATYKLRDGKPTYYSHETVGAAIARDIANRLHFKKEDREKLWTLVRWHMFSVSEFITDAAVRRFIRRVGAENTTDMLDVRTADRVGSGTPATSWRHEDFKRRIIKVQQHIPSVNDLAVDGTDVMKILSIPPGPKIGKVLKILFDEIMEDISKNNREYLLKRVSSMSS